MILFDVCPSKVDKNYIFRAIKIKVVEYYSGKRFNNY